jgi:hypothetical protein
MTQSYAEEVSSFVGMTDTNYKNQWYVFGAAENIPLSPEKNNAQSFRLKGGNFRKGTLRKMLCVPLRLPLRFDILRFSLCATLRLNKASWMVYLRAIVV